MRKNGTLIPGNLKSDHIRLNVPSRELDVYQDEQIQILDDWHNFTIEHDVLYTLYAGSLIGVYRTGYMIPWDDDIDLVVRPKDWEKVEYLWNKGTNHKSVKQGWKRKNIKLNGKPYTMLKYTDGGKKWFKIRDINYNFTVDVGGIDIWICSNNYRVQSHPHWICPGPTDTADPADFIIARFRSPNKIANARIVKKSIADAYLTKTYGNWKKPKHPGFGNTQMKNFR